MSSFDAGVAVRDITPDPGAPLWGYSDRSGPATGTLDPLLAKALVVRAPGGTVALAAMDLGRVPLAESCSRIRERVKHAGVDYVFMTATHTHHGPVMEAKGAPYFEVIETKIGDCIEEAAGRLQPARIGLGHAEIDIGHNRRKVLKDGRCFMIWRNEERIPTAPVDKDAAIMKVTTATGEPLAVLVHYACHPVVMGPSNLQYSADYVGEMTRLVKEDTGAECLFFQGGCGNINPYLDKTPIEQGAVDAMRGVGRECAEVVLGALPGIAAVDPVSPSVAYAEKKVFVGIRWDMTDPAMIEILREVYGPMFDLYIESARPDLSVPLAVVVLNNEIAFAGLPGEVFVQYQLELKSRSPLPNTFLCGYANDYFAYFPTVRDAAAGGYGGVVASYVGLGAGDKLVTEAEIEIGKLIGKLKSVCTPEDFVMFEDGPIPD